MLKPISYVNVVQFAILLLPTSLLMINLQSIKISLPLSLFFLGGLFFLVHYLNNSQAPIKTPYIKILSLIYGILILPLIIKGSTLSVVISIVELGAYLAIFYLVVNSLRSHDQIEKVVKWLLIILSAVIIFLLYKFLLVFNATYISLDTKLGSKFGKNSLAFFLVIFFPYAVFFALNKKKVIFYIITTILFTGILLTFSRTAWFITILILLGAFIVSRKKIKLALMAVILVIPLLAFNGEEFQQRLQSFSLLYTNGNFEGEVHSIDIRKELADISFESIGNNLFTGIGYGNFSSLTKNISVVDVGVSHNDYLQLFVEGGILLFIIFVIWLALIYIKAIKYLKVRNNYQWLFQATFLSMNALIIYMFFINVFHSLYFWVIMGLYTGIYYLMKEHVNEENNNILRNELSKEK